MIPGFEDRKIAANGQQIACSVGGDGPPLLLLHGYPQTRALWREVAPILARDFTVVAADLRGYGDSSKPQGVESYTFRAMGADQLALMAQLGFARFHLAGHDRGARTAYRMALDNPHAVQSLTLMDVVPTHHLLHELRRDVALSYYHWFFLAQPAPFPERMILSDPDAFYESCLLGWGAAKLGDFNPEALAAYRRAWHDPATTTAMCNDYRAGATLDFEMDAQDLGRQIPCPSLVLYGGDGAMARAYDIAATWAPHLAAMTCQPVPGGHFFVDSAPQETARALLGFLRS